MTIALALGGGAALGWSHIGVLRALQQHNVEIGAVAGTSIGALAAVCQAADRLDVLEGIARSANMRTVLRYLDPHFRKGAMLGGRTIARQLSAHLGELNFEDLPIPCAVVAADLIVGEAVVIDQGDIAEAVRASMAIPGIFHPVMREGRVLVDGGVIMPVPVKAVRQVAPEMPVLAINLQNDYAQRAQAAGMRFDDKPALTSMSVLRSATGLMLSQLARQSLTIAPPELELALQVGHIDARNFTRAHELIDIGVKAVEDALPAIRRLTEAPV